MPGHVDARLQLVHAQTRRGRAGGNVQDHGGGAGGNVQGHGGGAGGDGGHLTSGGSGGVGTSAAGGTVGSGGASAVPTVDAGPAGSCISDLTSRIRVTETDLGVAYAYNEVDNNGAALGLTPLAISPVPGGGSRVAFLGKGDNLVHVVTLDASDQVVSGSLVGLPGYDVQDLYADVDGGVVLVSRTAQGSTANNNCGDINNLCGLVANYPTAASCYDMYLVRFDGTQESWATKLTDTTPTLPAYGTSATTGNWIIYIWSQYAHNGRIAFDGENYAGYFGAAVTVPGQDCVGYEHARQGRQHPPGRPHEGGQQEHRQQDQNPARAAVLVSVDGNPGRAIPSRDAALPASRQAPHAPSQLGGGVPTTPSCEWRATG